MDNVIRYKHKWKLKELEIKLYQYIYGDMDIVETEVDKDDRDC